MAALLVTGGCSEAHFDLDKSLDQAIQKLFSGQRSPQQFMLVAVSDSDADARRAAVSKVAASKKSHSEWAVKGFIAIATLESDPQTRCSAIRALARTDDPRAAETMVKILNFQSEPAAEVRPPDNESRWEATVALADLSQRGKVGADLGEKARTTFLDRLKRDTSRHVRIAAARGAGCYRDESSVLGLIEGLHDADFAVVHECEESLVRLTGHTEQCRPQAWEEWLAANRASLFANSGAIPDSRRPPYTNSFEKAGYKMRQFWEWVVPAKK